MKACTWLKLIKNGDLEVRKCELEEEAGWHNRKYFSKMEVENRNRHSLTWYATQKPSLLKGVFYRNWWPLFPNENGKKCLQMKSDDVLIAPCGRALDFYWFLDLMEVGMHDSPNVTTEHYHTFWNPTWRELTSDASQRQEQKQGRQQWTFNN